MTDTNNFDFNQVGKRMPYNVPDRFFDKLEDSVMAEIAKSDGAFTLPQKSHRHSRIIRLTSFISVAAAAAVALVIILHKPEAPANESTDASFASVEQAYGNLSQSDQRYLMEAYQDDMFLNEQQ